MLIVLLFNRLLQLQPTTHLYQPLMGISNVPNLQEMQTQQTFLLVVSLYAALIDNKIRVILEKLTSKWRLLMCCFISLFCLLLEYGAKLFLM